MIKFGIDGEEAKKLDKWQNEHDKSCPYKKKQGAIGGRTTYSFSPTTLGVVIKVSCACGKEIDLTDYSSW